MSARVCCTSRVNKAVPGEVLGAATCGVQRGGIRPINSLKVQEDFMSTHASPRLGADDLDTRGAVAPRTPVRRLSTETKAAFKTTEFFAFVAVLVGILIAGAVVDSSDAGGYGARQVWLYATILTVGYMVSRGLAKSGSRERYDADDGNR
jgi:hypothetical protein